MSGQTAGSSDSKSSQVVVFPPIIPLSGFLLGVLLERLQPLGLLIPDLVRRVAYAAGWVVFCLGVAGFAWMVITMKRARTPIQNSATPTMLVQSGPFSWTRNPMYLFGSIAYAGLAGIFTEPWSLLLLPVVFAATHYGIVLREEAFLNRHFGAEYGNYSSRVSRWL